MLGNREFFLYFLLTLILMITQSSLSLDIKRFITLPKKMNKNDPISVLEILKWQTNGTAITIIGWIKINPDKNKRQPLFSVENLDTQVFHEDILTLFYDNQMADDPKISLEYRKQVDRKENESIKAHLQPDEWTFFAVSADYSIDELVFYFSDFSKIYILKRLDLNYRTFEIKNRLRIRIGCFDSVDGMTTECFDGSARDFSYFLTYYDSPEHLYLLNPSDEPSDPVIFTFDLYNSEARGGLSYGKQRKVFEVLNQEELTEKILVNNFGGNSQIEQTDDGNKNEKAVVKEDKIKAEKTKDIISVNQKGKEESKKNNLTENNDKTLKGSNEEAKENNLLIEDEIEKINPKIQNKEVEQSQDNKNDVELDQMNIKTNDTMISQNTNEDKKREEAESSASEWVELKKPTQETGGSAELKISDIEFKDNTPRVTTNPPNQDFQINILDDVNEISNTNESDNPDNNKTIDKEINKQDKSPESKKKNVLTAETNTEKEILKENILNTDDNNTDIKKESVLITEEKKEKGNIELEDEKKPLDDTAVEIPDEINITNKKSNQKIASSVVTETLNDFKDNKIKQNVDVVDLNKKEEELKELNSDENETTVNLDNNENQSKTILTGKGNINKDLPRKKEDKNSADENNRNKTMIIADKNTDNIDSNKTTPINKSINSIPPVNSINKVDGLNDEGVNLKQEQLNTDTEAQLIPNTETSVLNQQIDKLNEVSDPSKKRQIQDEILSELDSEMDSLESEIARNEERLDFDQELLELQPGNKEVEADIKETNTELVEEEIKLDNVIEEEDKLIDEINSGEEVKSDNQKEREEKEEKEEKEEIQVEAKPDDSREKSIIETNGNLTADDKIDLPDIRSGNNILISTINEKKVETEVAKEKKQNKIFEPDTVPDSQNLIDLNTVNKPVDQEEKESEGLDVKIPSPKVQKGNTNSLDINVDKKEIGLLPLDKNLSKTSVKDKQTISDTIINNDPTSTKKIIKRTTTELSNSKKTEKKQEKVLNDNNPSERKANITTPPQARDIDSKESNLELDEFTNDFLKSLEANENKDNKDINPPQIENLKDIINKPKDTEPVLPISFVNQVNEIKNSKEGQVIINSQKGFPNPDRKINSANTKAGSFAFNTNSSFNTDLFDGSETDSVLINEKNKLPEDFKRLQLLKPQSTGNETKNENENNILASPNTRLLQEIDSAQYDNILFNNKKHLFIGDAFQLDPSEFMNSPTIFVKFLFSGSLPREFRFLQLRNSSSSTILTLRMVQQTGSERSLKLESPLTDAVLTGSTFYKPGTIVKLAVSIIQHNNKLGFMLFDGKELHFSQLGDSSVSGSVDALFLDSSISYKGSFRFFMISILNDPSGIIYNDFKSKEVDENSKCEIPKTSIASKKCLECNDKGVLQPTDLECKEFCPLNHRSMQNICYRCSKDGCSELNKQFFKMDFVGGRSFLITKTNNITNFKNNFQDLFDVEIESIPNGLFDSNITDFPKNDSAILQINFKNKTEFTRKKVTSRLKPTVLLYDSTRTRLQGQVMEARFGKQAVEKEDSREAESADKRIRNAKVEDVFELLGFIVFLIWAITMGIGLMSVLWNCRVHGHKEFLYQKVLQSFVMFQYMVFWIFYNVKFPFNLLEFFHSLFKYSVGWHDIFTDVAIDNMGNDPDFNNGLIKNIHRRFYEENVSSAFLLTFAFVFILQGAVLLFYALIRVCYKKKPENDLSLLPRKRSCLAMMVEEFEFKILFSAFLIFVVEATVFAVYNVYGFDSNHIFFIISFVVAIIYLAITLALVLFVVLYAKKPSQILNQRNTLSAFGFIYEGLKIKLVQKLFQGIQYIHYASFSVVLVTAYDMRTLQITLNLSFLAVFFIFIFTTLPAKKGFDQYEQLIVHILLLIAKVFMTLIVLADTFDILSQYNKWVMGYVVAICVSAIVLWNFIVVTIKSAKHLYNCNNRHDDITANTRIKSGEDEERSNVLNYDEEVDEDGDDGDREPTRERGRKVKMDKFEGVIANEGAVERFNLSNKIKTKKDKPRGELDQEIFRTRGIDSRPNNTREYRDTADFNQRIRSDFKKRDRHNNSLITEFKSVTGETPNERYARHNRIVDKRLKKLEKLKEDRYEGIQLNDGGLRMDNNSPPLQRTRRNKRGESLSKEEEEFINNNFAYESDLTNDRGN